MFLLMLMLLTVALDDDLRETLEEAEQTISECLSAEYRIGLALLVLSPLACYAVSPVFKPGKILLFALHVTVAWPWYTISSISCIWL